MKRRKKTRKQQIDAMLSALEKEVYKKVYPRMRKHFLKFAYQLSTMDKGASEAKLIKILSALPYELPPDLVMMLVLMSKTVSPRDLFDDMIAGFEKAGISGVGKAAKKHRHSSSLTRFPDDLVH